MERCEAIGIDVPIVPGLHFYTLVRSESVDGIVNRLRADELL